MKMAMESMEMAPRAIPRPGRVPEQRLLSPKIDLRWWRRCGTFCGRRLDSLGFSPWREYIGGRAMSEGEPGAHTTWWLIASVVMMKMTDQLGTPRGRYDEHISKFSSVRNQGLLSRKKSILQKVMLASFAMAPDNL
jgi:hypothetical protein